MDPGHNDNPVPEGGEERIRARRQGPWQTVSPETPVFVDESGRRAVAVRGAAVAVAVLCALWMGGLVVGVTGFASFPSGRPLITGLSVVARTQGAGTAARLPAAHELASLSGVVHSRPGAAVDAVERSICLSGRPASGLHAPGGHSGSDRSHGLADRRACVTELATGSHRAHTRLV